MEVMDAIFEDTKDVPISEENSSLSSFTMIEHVNTAMESLSISHGTSVQDLVRTLDVANDVELEDTWIKTSKTLKDVVLLHKRARNNHFYPSNFIKEFYLYNLSTEHFPWIPSKELISHRLAILAGDLLNVARVNNVVLAGGAVALALDLRVTDSDLLAHSADLDFFIYGSGDNSYRQTLREITSLLSKYNPYYLVRSNVIDVFIPGARSVQLVFSKERDPYDVINVFDMGYVKAFFDGETVYASHLAIVALRDHATVCFGSCTESRFAKTLRKGFLITNGDVITKIQDDPHIIRSRFMVSCLKSEINKIPYNDQPSDVLKTLDRTIDCDNFSVKVHEYGHRRDAGKTLIPHYRLVDLSTLSLKAKGEKDSYSLSLREFDILLGGTPLAVTTNVFCIAAKVAPASDYSPAVYLTVHQSDFSEWVDEVKRGINNITQRTNDYDFPPIPGKERIYEDEWLKMKVKEDTEILDQFMMPLGRPLQIDDRVFCEVTFKLWGRRSIHYSGRKSKRIVWDQVHFCIYAHRIYVIT